MCSTPRNSPKHSHNNLCFFSHTVTMQCDCWMDIVLQDGGCSFLQELLPHPTAPQSARLPRYNLFFFCRPLICSHLHMSYQVNITCLWPDFPIGGYDGGVQSWKTAKPVTTVWDCFNICKHDDTGYISGHHIPPVLLFINIVNGRVWHLQLLSYQNRYLIQNMIFSWQ